MRVKRLLKTLFAWWAWRLALNGVLWGVLSIMVGAASISVAFSVSEQELSMVGLLGLVNLFNSSVTSISVGLLTVVAFCWASHKLRAWAKEWINKESEK